MCMIRGIGCSRRRKGSRSCEVDDESLEIRNTRYRDGLTELSHFNILC